MASLRFVIGVALAAVVVVLIGLEIIYGGGGQ